MVPFDVIRSMRDVGGLRIDYFDTSGKLYLEINFKIIQEQFPRWMEEMVLDSLGDIDREVYQLGYMAYIVQDDGSLLWKPTRKLRELQQRVL